jgi:predicted tellurium resistance membrane protein TerC
MGAVMILAGVALIRRFNRILYLFGTILIVSGIKMARAREGPDPDKNPAIAFDDYFRSRTISPESGLPSGSMANWH